LYEALLRFWKEKREQGYASSENLEMEYCFLWAELDALSQKWSILRIFFTTSVHRACRTPGPGFRQRTEDLSKIEEVFSFSAGRIGILANGSCISAHHKLS